MTAQIPESKSSLFVAEKLFELQRTNFLFVIRSQRHKIFLFNWLSKLGTKR
jgi:hypothetical protein